jgi:hypothetical protein
VRYLRGSLSHNSAALDAEQVRDEGE